MMSTASGLLLAGDEKKNWYESGNSVSVHWAAAKVKTVRSS